MTWLMASEDRAGRVVGFMAMRFRARPCALLAAAVIACGVDGPSKPLVSHADRLSAGQLDGLSLPPKVLAVTFDDGPGDRTVELSMYLKARGIRAAFFVNGAHLAATALPNPNGIGLVANPTAVLAQLVADGHLAGCCRTA